MGRITNRVRIVSRTVRIAMSSRVERIAQNILSHQEDDSAGALATMTFNRQTEVELKRLADALGCSEGDVVGYGVALLGVAVDARLKGWAIALVGPEGQVERIVLPGDESR
jgi:hypothetical protein